VSEVLRRLGRYEKGSAHQHITTRIKALDISTEHFKNRPKHHGGTPKKTAKDVLVKAPAGSRRRTRRYQLERALGEVGVPKVCVKCGNSGEWEGEPLQLEIDHENGDPTDSRRENLRYLCPNCH
jgi:hypothetical protein